MTVDLPITEPWQRKVINTYIDNPKNTIITVLSKRQCGKSVCIEIILLIAALTKQSVSICVSPTLEQSRKVYNDICKLIKDTPLLAGRNSTLLTIQLINGSELLFKSAEQRDTLRGYTVSGVLCVDEAAFIQDEVFYELLLPWTNVHRASIILTSTPKFKSGFFYKNYSLGGQPGHITIDWGEYDTSKYLSRETLEMYRQQLPRQIFRSEFLGKFCEADSLVFGDFKHSINNSLQVSTTVPTILAIDWGSGQGQDFTAISILQMIDGTVIVPKVVYFNDKNVNQTITIIKELILKYSIQDIIIEKNSIGTIYYDILCQDLEEFDVTIHSFYTSNTSKVEIIQQLIVAFEQNLIQITDDPELVTELSNFETRTTATGKLTYMASSGHHDDLVMSMAIGFWFINKLNEI